MERKPSIAIADVRRNITLNEQDTLDRHHEYMEELRKFPSFADSHLIAIQPSFRLIKSRISTYKSISICEISIRDLFKLRNTFREIGNELKLLVAGDPSESLAFARMLRIFLRDSTIPIQAQIHGEYSEDWAKLNLRNTIRRSIAKRQLNSATTIRTVSEEQTKYIKENFLISKKKFSTIPVRLNKQGARKLTPRVGTINSIGFVGRIHQERNVAKFVEIAKYFLERNPKMEIYVIGKSTKDTQLEESLKNISKSQVKFLGQLDKDELEYLWSKIGVLISTAATESYGRAIREALMHDVPVLAQSSMGSRDLQKECPGAVRLFSDFEPMPEIYKKYMGLINSRVSQGYKEYQAKSDLRVATQIAESWKEAIESEHIG